jgi:hypothetical protein
VAKRKITQGGFVRHHDGREVFKVLSIDDRSATLLTAENKYHGYFSLNELKAVDPDKVKTATIWIA